MKIAIASDDGERIAAHTGRCRGFAIFEVTEKAAQRVEFRENTFTAHARGECHDVSAHHGDGGHHTHAPLVNAIVDCCVLVTRGLGPRLVADLAASGIDAYVCAAETVDDAATQFAGGRLQRVQGTGCGRHC